MTPGRFHLVSQVGRVPSMTVRLDGQQEVRFQRLMEESIMIDLHQHPMVLPEDFSQYWEYLRSDSYVWGYDAVSPKHRWNGARIALKKLQTDGSGSNVDGGWPAVCRRYWGC